ncbi:MULTISPECIES: phage major capsid protein, P2 family [unclassified Methylophaga]|jgi:P2 family phage major capsid protein|uniref:phage major capsid protein, P2 family n=1 Tax=unclassified Methylophaga TaxID=2629249 RepID=UPI00259CA95C|nr:MULTISPECIES: phage major capsid protein, P2 family [unclassified Methylophaga]|tara:strand:+ start:14269 stop:15297 length:1029 start_codon:yes stop_codon:yes gene_type:complete
MNLSQQGRQALDLHFVNTARGFGLQPGNPSAGQHYAATPTVAQTIYNKIIEDGNPFLRQINGAVPVAELKGEKVGMFLSGRVASRTDTTGSGERVPKHLADTDSKGYECFKTEFDVAIKYALIDAWAKFPDFASRYMQLVRQAIGNDMLTIGWHGTSVSTNSDINANPNLEDMNIGWLQKIRDFNGGSQHLAAATNEVVLGSADFKNLDVLAHEARQMLPIYHRNRDDLVFIVGSDILSSQEGTYYETNGNTPTEKAMLSGRITKAYGNMPTMYAPFFPEGKVLVTPLKNLSIYVQDSSVRRLQKDKPEKDEVQDFNSANQGYVVEDEELTAFIEGIQLTAE